MLKGGMLGSSSNQKPPDEMFVGEPKEEGGFGGAPAGGAILVIAGLAALLASLDSALNIAFPDVTAHFDVDVAAIRWLVISYVSTYAVLLLVAGRIADRLGHFRMLVGGLVVSTVAFVATGLAPTYELLLCARVIQGVGAAMILGAAPALVTLAIAADRQGRALGLFHMSASIGLAIGPLVGGLLVGGFGWRSVFLFRVPIAVAVLALAWSTSTRGLAQEADRADNPGRINPAGGLGAVVAVLRRPSVVVANVLNLVSNAALFAIWLLVPYYAVNVIDLGTALGGLLLMIAPLATSLSAPPAGWLADRFGTSLLSTSGLGLQAAALGILSRLDGDSSVVLPAIALALVGVGISIFTVPNMRYVMGAISDEHQGVAGSTVQTMRTAGIVMGVMVAGALFEDRRLAAAERFGAEPDGPVSFVPAFRSTLTIAAVVATVAAGVSLVRLGLEAQRGGSIWSASSATRDGKSGPAARVAR